MMEKPPANIAEALYDEGMRYNWRQAASPANAALARAGLERAASLGHMKALREAAEMMFLGSGGPKDEEHALWLKWAAFVRGDGDALEELSALLGSYAESASDPSAKRDAARAALQAEEADERLRRVGTYVHDLLRKKMSGHQED